MGKKKNKHLLLSDVLFTGIADAGQAVGKTAEGQVVFAKGVVPGDRADVLAIKKRKGYFLGIVKEIRSYSPERRDPFCVHFGACGGCKWQNLNYAEQLRQKTAVVENALLRIGKVSVAEWRPIVPSARETFYRNKMEFAFANKRWLSPEELNTGVSNAAAVLGFHPAGGFDKVIDIHDCWLQEEPANHIRNTIRQIALDQGLSFYDIKAHQGFLRNLMLRITTTGEVMALLSFGHDDPAQRETFLQAIQEQLPGISSLMYCINPKYNDTVFDLEMHLVAGNPYVEEILGEVRFRIGPKSFFQTNTRQGQALYEVVAEFAELSGQENVYDLYTGIGSIGLFLANRCRQIVGIEEVPAAIADARDNATRNGIANAIFYAGDVGAILNPEFAETHGRPDVLITDPPRAGMHEAVVQTILELAAPKVVYVSCNPATQARDLALLQARYRVSRVQPVDMFPHTHHIENVALLELLA